MKPRKLGSLTAVICISLASHTARATDIVWDANLGAGPWVWNTGTNWIGGTAPTVNTDRADLRKDWTAAATINLSAATTTNGILFDDTGAASDVGVTIGNGGTAGNTLTLAGTTPVIQTSGSTLTTTTVLAGTTGWSKTGAGTLILNNSANTLTGAITVSAGVLQIRDGTTNSPDFLTAGALSGSSITAQTGTTLDLPRLHATTVQTVTWNVPALTLESGASLRFRASTGSNTHNMAAAITTSGTTTINNNGGGYAQDINLTGKLSGSGTINYLATSGSGSATTTRTLTLSNATTNYTGNWFIDYTGSTSDDFVALRAGAAGALGTGTVTLDDRAVLINNATNGINSLAGVVIQKATSSLTLNGNNAWINTAATLTASVGTINLGTAASSIGSATLGGASIVDSTAGPLALASNLTLSGTNTYTINRNPAAAGQLVTLITYGGTLAGGSANFALANLANYRSAIFAAGSGAVSVDIGSKNLTWTGSNSTDWAVAGATPNWSDGADSTTYWGDFLTFDDSGSNKTVNLVGDLRPAAVTVNNSTGNDYAFIGTGVIGQRASLTKSGTGALTVSQANTYGGGTTVSGGVLTAAIANSLGAGTVTVTGGRVRAGDNAGLGTGTLALNGGALSSDGATARALANNITLGGNVTLGNATDNGALTLSGTVALTGNRTVTTASAATLGGIISGNGYTLTKDGASTLTLSGVNTFDGGVTVDGGKLLLGNAAGLGAAGSKTVTVNTGGQFDFNGISPGTTRTYSYRIAGTGDGTGALVNNSATGVGTNAGIQNLYLLDNATIGGAGRFDIARVGSTSGTITGNGYTLTKAGGNQVQLRGAATNLPAIIVNGGILGAEDSDLAFGGATGNVTVNNSATLSTYGARAIATPVTLNTGSTLGNLGGGTGTWTGTITTSGSVTINPAGQTITLNGSLAGTGTITVPANGGTLNLSGTNTFSGGLIITHATNNTATTVNLPSGTSLAVAVSKPILVGNNASSGANTAQTFNVAGTVSDNGTLYVGRSGFLNVNNGAVWTQNGDMTVAGQGGYTATMNVNAGSSFTYAGTNTIKINPGSSGNANLNIDGLFTTSQGFETNFTGGPTYKVTLQNGGTLKLSGNITELTNGATNKTQFALGTGGGIIDTNGFKAGLSYGITGTSLTKQGTGTLTLSGANAYTGTTAVNNGTLLVNGSNTGTGTVSVAGGAKLGGTGSIAGAVNVSGTLAPGASIESLSSGTLTFSGGSSFAYEMNSSAVPSVAGDLQQVFGDLALSGTVALDLTDLAATPKAFAAPTKLSLINYTGIWNGGFFTYGSNVLENGESFTAGLNTWRINYAAISGGLNFASEYVAGQFVTLTAVPEPGSWLALGCLIGSGVCLRRRVR